MSGSSPSAPEGVGFLQRWSRRKAGTATTEDKASPADPGAAATPASPPAGDGAAAAVPDPAAARPVVEGAGAPPEPLPTLADVAALAPGADIARFMRPGVDGAVRNAALKKLFSDAHFNVMDGLDTYIDDYGKPDPLPLAMLLRMRQSAVLGLLDDDAAGNAPAPGGVQGKTCPDGSAARPMAQSTPAPSPAADTEPSDEDDPDLRLQPDDADRRPGAGADPER